MGQQLDPGAVGEGGAWTKLESQYFALQKLTENQHGYHLTKFSGRVPKFCVQSQIIYVVEGMW